MAVLGDNAVFTGCKFIGRQDTLYGATGISAMFNQCDVLGAVDYIFGGMTAVFYRCQLRLNTSEADSDVAYITAAQQSGGRGYLMYECNVTSTTPGVDTASQYRSKPGYFGRPWAANTSEVVFYNTTVETTDFKGQEGKSLIAPAGWNNTLGGESPMMYEYGTKELSGENNSASRAAWAKLLESPVIDDGKTEITLGAFYNKTADYTNVDNAVKKAQALNAKDYKVDKQGEVEKMADDILAAIASLEKNTPDPTPDPAPAPNPAPTPDPTPGTDDKTQGSDASDGNTDNSGTAGSTENTGAADTATATGDVYNTALYAVILMLAAIAGVTVLAVSKKRTDR